MITENEGPNGLSPGMLYDILAVCAGQGDVREEVIRNHDDDRWWPRDVEDWRLRMVIAGWSTRVSYTMITTYQRVVRQAAYIGYENLCSLETQNYTISWGLSASSQPVGSICTPYALSSTASVETLDVLDGPNDLLINEMAKRVKGAGYKVAQCAVSVRQGIPLRDLSCGFWNERSPRAMPWVTATQEPHRTRDYAEVY